MLVRLLSAFVLKGYIDGLVQERRNSIANALELLLSCTKSLIWVKRFGVETRIFREDKVNNMAADVLAPCATGSSAGMISMSFYMEGFQQPVTFHLGDMIENANMFSCVLKTIQPLKGQYIIYSQCCTSIFRVINLTSITNNERQLDIYGVAWQNCHVHMGVWQI